MSTAIGNAALGPVSRVLESDVRNVLTKHNLVIWLDADNHYCDFVEQLIQLRQNEQLKYDVYTFRGSHLELMLELEDVTGGVDKTRALIHLPGFNEESVKATPLFELYRAGRRYRKALSTLVADAVTQAGPSLQATDSLQSAVDEYTRVGAEVDQAHRHLEQNRQKLLRSQMPEFVALRSCLDRMQVVWRNWADAWAREFNAVCKTHGLLPDSALQQRTLFDQQVKPLTSEHGTTAYFVIDALRHPE